MISILKSRCTSSDTYSESHPGLGAQKEGNPICMKGARTQFHCCNFYGQITATHDETQTEADKAYFNRCSFNEDYYDADDNTTYSFSADCNYGCGNVFAEHKTYIAHFGYQGITQFRRATFEGCTFNSNYGSGICSLMGVWPGGPLINAIQVRNCHFYNGGLDGLPPSFFCYNFTNLLVASSRSLMNFTGVNFIGRSQLEYSRAGDCDFSVSGVCNNPSFLNYKWRVQGCWSNGNPGIDTDPTYQNLHEYLHEYYFALNGNCAPPAPLPGAPPFLATDVTIKTNYDGCQNRYINYATLQLFSSGVGDMAEPAYSYVCGSSPRLVKPQSKDQNNDGIIAFPIPATNEVSIQNVSVGDEVTLFDILGNLLLKQTALSNSLSFDISEFPNGIYFVRLQNNKATKIIKAD